MDPLSQGVLGGSASLSVANRAHIVKAISCGVLAGMAPDLDAFIRSDQDPLLYLEYHRQFTHALIFIPFGALICALILWASFARKLPFSRVYLYCLVGYATHGLLDSCTTYGTQLFWPFSNARVAWHTVSIIDPLFTVPLVLLVILGALKRSKHLGRIALLWALTYLAIGAWQGHRAEMFGRQLASSRGHAPARLEAKPSFANILVWKIIYQVDGYYYVDAVHLGLQTTFYAGKSIPRLDVAKDLPWLDHNSQQARDIERFRWFSNDYLALSTEHPNFIIDMRYSLLPNQVTGMWGIKLFPYKTSNEHVEFIWNRRTTREDTQSLLNMVLGRPP